jgi:transcriptional regulator with GAF, ATPase, and Fis domain
MKLGNVLAGRYRLERLLERRGDNVIHLATDQLLQRKVVLKTATEQAARQRVREEYRLLSSLSHPNLVRVHDLVAVPGSPRGLALVEDHAPGQDLLAWARGHGDLARTCRAVGAVLRALSYLHRQGVWHRDLKPQNIVVEDAHIGRLPAARLLDFGLAGAADPRPAGTLGYVAPEVLAGGAASAAADIYSLGATLHEVVFGTLPALDSGSSRPFGRNPLDGRAPIELHPLGELLGDMLNADPAARPGAADLMTALGPLADAPLQLDEDELRGPYLPDAPLLGREPQLERLDAMLAALRTGRGATAVRLDGAGKSRFARAVRRLARCRGIEVLAAASVGELARTLGVVEACDSHQRIAAAVIDRWIERAGRGPLLIDLDGCPAADPEAELLAQVQRAVSSGELPSLLLLWSGPLPDGVPSEGFQRVELAELDEEQVAELLRRTLYHVDAPPPWLPRLQQVSGGDPRWVVPLMLAQVEAGLPDRLLERTSPVAAQRRAVADLPDGPRRLLALFASVTGEVPAALVEELSRDDPSALAWLERRGLVSVYAGGLRVSAPGLRDAIDLGQDRDASRRAHHRLAAAFSRLEPADPARLGHHLVASGKAEAGASALLEAPYCDEDDLVRVEQLLPRGPLWAAVSERLARMERQRGALDQARTRARRLADHDPVAGRLLEVELLHEAGLPGPALELLEEVAAITARSELVRARARFTLGDHRGAGEAAARGREMLGEIGEQPSREAELIRVELANLAALCAIYAGDPDRGLQEIAAVEDLAHRLGRRETLARLANSKGIALQRTGRLAGALAAFEDCGRHARALGDLRIAAAAALNIGTVAHRKLRLARALAGYREAYRLASRAAVGLTRVSALANEANLLLFFGAEQEAEAKLDRAAALAGEVGARAFEGHLELYRAELELRRGARERAARSAAVARERFDAEDRSAQDAGDLVQIELWLRQGHPDGAIGIGRQLLKRMTSDDPDRARAHLLLGRAHLQRAERLASEGTTPSTRRPHSPEPRREELDMARRQLDLALAVGEAAGGFDRGWECHALLARCYRALGDAERTREQARHVRRKVARLRESVPGEYRACLDRRQEIVEALALAAEHGGQETPLAAALWRVLEINKELNQRLPLKELLARILDRALELGGAERAFIVLLERGRLRVAASRNVDRQSVSRGLESFSHSIAESVITSGSAVISTDATSDPRFAERLSIQGLRLKAVLCVPLGSADRVSGALYLDNRFGADAFHEGHLALVQAFADQASLALYNARLLHDATLDREALARTRAELEQANSQLDARLERSAQQLSEISERLRSHERELVRRYNASNIIGRSRPMQRLFLQIDRVAETDLPVFIHGESGTGKELVARAIHHTSPRRDHPFISINCAAIPESLLQSELFGHARGAFTGAVQDRVGLFEAAGEGTLLLDEIGDMPAEMQVQLLRVLQEGTFRRVGEQRERRRRCRVLSASHRALKQLVEEGLFREDLFYRLDVLEIEVPPLRDRRADIPLLVEHLLGQLATPLTVAPEALAALIEHDWPGNVRQLENELQRAGTLCSGGRVTVANLSPELRARRARRPAVEAGGVRLERAVRDFEREMVLSSLRRCSGNVTRAAVELGLHRVALHKKMRRLEIDREALNIDVRGP